MRYAITTALLAVGCGGAQTDAEPPAESTSPPPAAAEPAPAAGSEAGGDSAHTPTAASAGEAVDFSDWRTLEKLTPNGPIRSEGHKGAWVDIYASADVAATYREHGGPYPVGARLVKVHYEDETGGEIVKVPVMQKMEPGYDPDNGDWYYGVYGASGTEAKASGRMGKCIGCHESADTGHVFGRPAAN